MIKTHNVFKKYDLYFSLQGTETFNTFASFDADSEGTFFVSVVAVNPANEASKAVCSDGVTVSSFMPSVKDVVVTDIRGVQKLVVDNNNKVWFLDRSLKRHPINSSQDCG